MAQDDYAVLVGISRYADKALSELKGPVRDVEAMYEWLVDPQGGDVPRDNVKKIVTDEVKVPAAPNYTPVLDDFINAFSGIVLNADETSVVRRPNSRLYLFFAGHGFCERQESSAHAALYVANVTRIRNLNICGTYYARWARDQGAFGEIVLVMDCCRDAELYKEALPVFFKTPADPTLSNGVKLFEVYATSRGGKAKEDVIPERQNTVHGLLTHALLKALARAAALRAQLSSTDIKGYIQENWSVLCNGNPPALPEFIPPPNGELLFGRPAPEHALQGFKLVKAVPGDKFRIRGPKYAVLAILTIGAEVHVERDGQVENLPIVDGRFAVHLPTTFCLAVGVAGGNPIEKDFQVGAADVEL